MDRRPAHALPMFISMSGLYWSLDIKHTRKGGMLQLLTTMHASQGVWWWCAVLRRSGTRMSAEGQQSSVKIQTMSSCRQLHDIIRAMDQSAAPLEQMEQAEVCA